MHNYRQFIGEEEMRQSDNFISLIKNKQLTKFDDFAKAVDALISQNETKNYVSIVFEYFIPMVHNSNYLGKKIDEKIKYFIEQLYKVSHQKNPNYNLNILTEGFLIILQKDKQSRNSELTDHKYSKLKNLIFNVAKDQYGISKEAFIFYLADEILRDKTQATITANFALSLINEFIQDEEDVNLYQSLLSKYPKHGITPLALLFKHCVTQTEPTGIYIKIFKHKSFLNLSPQLQIAVYSYHINQTNNLPEYHFSVLGAYLIMQNRKVLPKLANNPASEKAAAAEESISVTNPDHSQLLKQSTLAECGHFTQHYQTINIDIVEVIRSKDTTLLYKKWAEEVDEAFKEIASLNQNNSDMEYYLVAQFNFLVKQNKTNKLDLKNQLTSFIVNNFNYISKLDLLINFIRENADDIIDMNQIAELSDNIKTDPTLMLITKLWKDYPEKFWQQLGKIYSLTDAMSLTMNIYANSITKNLFTTKYGLPRLNNNVKIKDFITIRTLTEIWEAQFVHRAQIVTNIEGLIDHEALEGDSLSAHEVCLKNFFTVYQKTSSDLFNIDLNLVTVFAKAQKRLIGFFKILTLYNQIPEHNAALYENLGNLSNLAIPNGDHYLYFAQFLAKDRFNFYHKNEPLFFANLTKEILDDKSINDEVRQIRLRLLFVNGIFNQIQATVTIDESDIINSAQIWLTSLIKKLYPHSDHNKAAAEPESPSLQEAQPEPEIVFATLLPKEKTEHKKNTEKFSRYKKEKIAKFKHYLNQLNIENDLKQQLAEISEDKLESVRKDIIKRIDALTTAKDKLLYCEITSKIIALHNKLIDKREDLNCSKENISKTKLELEEDKAAIDKIEFELNKSALLIQTKARQFLAQNTAQQIRQDNETKADAATIIQTKARQFLAQNTAHQIRQDNKIKANAATIIQGLPKIVKAKEILKTKQTEKQNNLAATTIQTKARQFLAAKTVHQVRQNSILEAGRQQLQTMNDLNLAVSNQIIMFQSQRIETLLQEQCQTDAQIRNLQTELHSSQKSNQTLLHANQQLQMTVRQYQQHSAAANYAYNQRAQSFSSLSSNSSPEENNVSQIRAIANQKQAQTELYIKLHNEYNVSLEEIAKMKGQHDAKSDLGFDPDLTINGNAISLNIYREAFDQTIKNQYQNQNKSAARSF